MKKTVLKVPCVVYSRVVGYLRPVQDWHQGKQQEFSERKTFKPIATVEEEHENSLCETTRIEIEKETSSGRETTRDS